MTHKLYSFILKPLLGVAPLMVAIYGEDAHNGAAAIILLILSPQFPTKFQTLKPHMPMSKNMVEMVKNVVMALLSSAGRLV